MLSNYGIIFLIESWTNHDSKIDFLGYVCYNLYRKFQNKKARRRSGGIVIYYKECFKIGISIVRNHHDTIIWLRLDKTFFSLQNDVYLCGVYIWGDKSPAYNCIDCNLFQILEADIYDFQLLGTTIIAGDFNSRVGCKQDFIEFDANI